MTNIIYFWNPYEIWILMIPISGATVPRTFFSASQSKNAYTSLLEFRTTISRPILLNSEIFGKSVSGQNRKVRKFWKTHVWLNWKSEFFGKIIPYFESGLHERSLLICPAVRLMSHSDDAYSQSCGSLWCHALMPVMWANPIPSGTL